MEQVQYQQFRTCVRDDNSFAWRDVGVY